MSKKPLFVAVALFVTFFSYSSSSAEDNCVTKPYSGSGDRYNVSCYDGNGHVIEYRDYNDGKVGYAYTATYDKQGRETSFYGYNGDPTDPNTTPYGGRLAAYDENGNRTLSATVENGKISYAVTNEYDENGRVTTHKQYNGDPATSAAKSGYTRTYDENGRILSSTSYNGDPDKDGTITSGYTRTYDEKGKLIESTNYSNGKGSSTTYENGRVVEYREYSGIPSEESTVTGGYNSVYDDSGHLISQKKYSGDPDNGGTLIGGSETQFDEKGRIISSLSYSGDLYNGGSVTSGYARTYDENGRITETANYWSNGGSVTTYDENGHQTSNKVYSGDPTNGGTVTRATEYTWGDDGRITTWNEYRSNDGNYTVSNYGYTNYPSYTKLSEVTLTASEWDARFPSVFREAPNTGNESNNNNSSENGNESGNENGSESGNESGSGSENGNTAEGTTGSTTSTPTNLYHTSSEVAGAVGKINKIIIYYKQ